MFLRMQIVRFAQLDRHREQFCQDPTYVQHMCFEAQRRVDCLYAPSESGRGARATSSHRRATACQARQDQIQGETLL